MRPSPLPALIWSILILAIVAMPPSGLPHVEVRFLDKLVHAGMFAIFAVLWRHPFSSPRALRFMIPTGVAYAAATELVQGLLPWDRTPDLMDFVANLTGLLLGLVAHSILGKAASKRQ